MSNGHSRVDFVAKHFGCTRLRPPTSFEDRTERPLTYDLFGEDDKFANCDTWTAKRRHDLIDAQACGQEKYHMYNCSTLHVDDRHQVIYGQATVP